MQAQKQTSLISIKIKTLNSALYQLTININDFVSTLNQQIQQKIGVPTQSQRLLFRGMMLQSYKRLKQYKIQQGHVIQLIANRIPSQISSKQSSRMSQMPRNNHIFSRQHARYKKHRYLQQRIGGFKINTAQSMQVLKQNKHVIDQLLLCLNYNYQTQQMPFKIQKKKLEIGQWIDIKDSKGQWSQGQIINHYGHYVLVHYNGLQDKWNEWIAIGSDRIMPFRTHTIQSEKSNFLSPTPKIPPIFQAKQNKNFQSDINKFISEIGTTIDEVNILLKDLNLSQKIMTENIEEKNQTSLKNEVNGTLSNLETKHVENFEQQKKQEFETPSKDIPINDNISNKCEDNISKCDNDDISNKSVTSKRSQGLVDTASMKSLIIDEQRHKQNKVFFDYSEAQSVRSVKNKNYGRYLNIKDPIHILQEQQSQLNEQDYQFDEDHKMEIKKQRALQRKMKASQLAPLLDRMGRLLIDLAPHVAMMGYTEQASLNWGSSSFNQNLSTLTNEGSLQSKLANLHRGQSQRQRNHVQQNGNIVANQSSNSEQVSQRLSRAQCQFQIPVMLNPGQILRLNQLIESDFQQLQQGLL